MELHTKKTYAMNGVSVLIDTNIANLPSIITPFFTSLFFHYPLVNYMIKS